MGPNLSAIMAILTIIALIGGAFFGLIRGRNRSILRLLMIIACIVVAFSMRGALMDVIMGIETPEGTLKEVLLASFSGPESGVPASLQNLIFALLEIIIGLVSYFVLFFLLRFVTEIILFPILKIFIRPGKKRGTGFGVLVGVLQGVVIAFAVLVPMNGLLIATNEISQIEIEGHHLIEMPEEMNFKNYSASPMSKIYTTIGGWYFDSMTDVEMEDGKHLNISDACNMMTTVTGVAGTVTDLTESVEILGKEDAKPEEKVDAIKQVGENLIEIGEKIDNLSENATEIIDDIIEDVKEMIKTESEGNSEGIDELLDNLDLEKLNLKSVGQGLIGIVTYIEKTELSPEPTEQVNQEDVNNIIQGLAGSTPILDLLTSGGEENTPTLLQVPEEHQDMFETAIDSVEEMLTEDQVQALKNLFGIE